MRKTEYDSYVEVYMTTEERCALSRLINKVEFYMFEPKGEPYTDTENMKNVLVDDILTLHNLVDFVYGDPPNKACKRKEVTFDILRTQRIKRIS